jgi:hypothetical protein
MNTETARPGFLPGFFYCLAHLRTIDPDAFSGENRALPSWNGLKARRAFLRINHGEAFLRLL